MTLKLNPSPHRPSTQGTSSLRPLVLRPEPLYIPHSIRPMIPPALRLKDEGSNNFAINMVRKAYEGALMTVPGTLGSAQAVIESGNAVYQKNFKENPYGQAMAEEAAQRLLATQQGGDPGPASPEYIRYYDTKGMQGPEGEPLPLDMHPGVRAVHGQVIKWQDWTRDVTEMIGGEQHSWEDGWLLRGSDLVGQGAGSLGIALVGGQMLAKTGMGHIMASSIAGFARRSLKWEGSTRRRKRAFGQRGTRKKSLRDWLGTFTLDKFLSTQLLKHLV